VKLRYIDPPTCGCTDCLTGEAVPLDQASNEQLIRLTAGRVVSRLPADTPVALKSQIAIVYAGQPYTAETTVETVAGNAFGMV
jgi:hypothetical protein